MSDSENQLGQVPVSSASKMRRKENGDIDILHAVGGIRGIIEALLPGLLFLVAFLVTQKLVLALIIAAAVSAVFAVIRLAQKGSLVQSLSGLVGLAICAFAALKTGNAVEFYLPGLFLNLGYAVVLTLTVIFKVPAMGFLFSLVRGEEKTWRNHPDRVKAYTVATLVLVAMFVLRLAVKYPLYLAENVTWLGIAQLFLGTPLYAAVLWLSWMVSRPKNVIEAEMVQNHEL